jgi:fatty-acyl-CoA synthase
MPAFVRVLNQAMDVTGTLKQRKLSLVGDGWDPTKTRDPLYVRDDAGSTYVPLTAERADAIRSGRLRL